MIPAQEFLFSKDHSALVANSLSRLKVKQLKDLASEAVRSELFEVCSSVVDDIRRNCRKFLQNPQVSFVAIRNPDAEKNASTLEGQMQIAVTHLLSAKSFFEPEKDTRSGVPLTIYSAQLDNERALKEAGIKYYSPTEKLGHHNDGYVSGRNMIVPDYIAITNFFIGYADPGNFYYIPFALWDDFPAMAKRGIALGNFLVETLPFVYGSESAYLEKIVPKKFSVQSFGTTKDGHRSAFLNGDWIDHPDSSPKAAQLWMDMRRSLWECPNKIAVPQRLAQTLVMRNDLGVHGRDIFDKVKVTSGKTRVFGRSLSGVGWISGHQV